MKVAITGAAGYLGRALVPVLAQAHEVFAFDIVPPVEKADVVDEDEARRICTGMDAVVHLASAGWDGALAAAANEARILDTRLKGTNALLQAGRKAGVERVVQVSDLCILDGYDEDLLVSEDFLPLPDTSAYQQAVYLSEIIGREHAREARGLVLTLRLGQIVEADKLAPQASYDPAWLDLEDAVRAVQQGLAIERFDHPDHWGLYNIAADVEERRYSLIKWRHGPMAFDLAEDFAAWREV